MCQRLGQVEHLLFAVRNHRFDCGGEVFLIGSSLAVGEDGFELLLLRGSQETDLASEGFDVGLREMQLMPSLAMVSLRPAFTIRQDRRPCGAAVQIKRGSDAE